MQTLLAPRCREPLTLLQIGNILGGDQRQIALEIQVIQDKVRERVLSDPELREWVEENCCDDDTELE